MLSFVQMTTRPEEPQPHKQIARQGARPLPEVMRKTAPATKLLYFYLRTQGLVAYSHRELGDALGLTHYTVQRSFERLDKIKAIKWHTPPTERTKREYEAVPMDELEGFTP